MKKGYHRPMLNVMRSNRVEVLADILAERATWPGQSVFAPSTIAVSSKAWRQWVPEALAERLGIAANLRLPLLGDAVNTLLAEVCGRDTVIAGPEHYTLAVLAEIPRFEQSESEQARLVLGTLPDGPTKLNACREFGLFFHGYNSHRPDGSGLWPENEAEPWQIELWRKATQRIESSRAGHGVLAPQHALERLLQAPTTTMDETPPFHSRLAVFAPAGLTPLQLLALGYASQRIDVDVYLLESTREYWGDVRGRRDLGMAPRLIHSLGRVEREVREVLEGWGEYAEPGGDLFRAPTGDHLLATLQRRTLGLTEGTDPGADSLARDRSLEIHCCPGRLREIEVVHALVGEELALGARPEDILVLAPDMAQYAPFVEAVFTGPDSQPTIPFNLGGEPIKTNASAVDVATKLLQLSASRLSAPEILEFLWLPAVRERYELSEPDLKALRNFIEQAAIRFGLDAAHREAHGFGRLEENTLGHGIERLLMGYAVSEEVPSVVCGIAPAGGADGDLAPVLGAFAQISSALAIHLPRLNESHSLRGWQDAIDSAVEDFTGQTAAIASERRSIRETLARLVATAEEAGFEEPLDPATARALLLPKLLHTAPRRDYFRGGVEFASLAAAAGVPAKIVFVLGMNDGEWPDPAHRSCLDLLAYAPRQLDPSPRLQDQRDLFVALLGARQRFVLTYCGTSQQDGSSRPPSVIIEEIIEAAAEVSHVFVDDIRAHLLVRHPLSRFHPTYFSGDPRSRLWSASEANLACAAAVFAGAEPWRAMKGELKGLRTDDPPTGIIAMEDISRVLGRPLAHLWKRVLGANLPSLAEAPLPDYEPADRDALVDFESRELFLRTVVNGKDPKDAMEFLLARGSFPPTELGRIRCEELLSSAMDLARVANGLCLGESMDDEIAEVDLTEGQRATQILGTLPGRRRGGRLEVTSSRNPKRLLDAWVRHLVMCAGVSEARAFESFVVRRAEKRDIEVWRMPSLDRSQSLDFMRRLIGLYRQAWTIPLRVFPEASFAFANTWFQSQSEDQAWDSAWQSWQLEGRSAGGDDQERALARYLFGQSGLELLVERPEPPELSFAELSGLIFGPMFELCPFEVQRNP